jgi:hypothetical protein
MIYSEAVLIGGEPILPEEKAEVSIRKLINEARQMD